MISETRYARVKAFAKLNLCLEVLHRRPDGYHNLRTIFQTVSLADIIDIEVSASRRTQLHIECEVTIPGENLITLAADKVLAATKARAAIRFRLRKVIPMGAGLGGGSSDAAAVLLALPALLGKSLPVERLFEMGAGLGSDVPFFLHGGTAVGLGRGTELYPLPDIPAWPALIVASGIHVSTADAYRALARTSHPPDPAGASPSERVARALASNTDWTGSATNDFEEAVSRLHPELAAIRRTLTRAGASPAMMTGSGSAMFGVFESKEARDAAARCFPEDQVYPVSLLSRRRYRAIWARSLAGVC